MQKKVLTVQEIAYLRKRTRKGAQRRCARCELARTKSLDNIQWRGKFSNPEIVEPITKQVQSAKKAMGTVPEGEREKLELEVQGFGDD